MERRQLDIRSSTCRGGGALWAFLSHVREIPRGGVLEVITDDEQALSDHPEWADHEGWRVVEQHTEGRDLTFALKRPWRRRPVAH